MKVLLTPHQEKFAGRKTKRRGYLSRDEVIREALRADELMEQEDKYPRLEAALRQALRSPLEKFKSGRFAALALPLEARWNT